MRRVGDRGVLLELADNAAVHAAARLARERLGDELLEVVPGHQTLLLVWRDGSIISDIPILALERPSSEISDDEASSASALTIPVRYDGDDLDAVASALALSVERTVVLHSSAEYVVAFMGFAPGFPYLIAAAPAAGQAVTEPATGETARLLALPRLQTPRTEVPSGSVAVAAGYCGIYPRSSPGGWNLLGHTDVVLFDVERDPPALLEPGTRVRFAAVP